jgi:hypothetical protein
MKAAKTAKKEEKVTKPAETNKEAEVKKLYIVAVVMNGKYEVRRYTLEEHGKNFAELANEFASKKGYQIELV